MNKHMTSFRVNRWNLIQPRLHLLLGHGNEARRLEIETLGDKAGADMWRHELLVEVGCDGKFYGRLEQAKR